MQLEFCEYCMNEQEYNIYKTEKISTLKSENIKYIGKKAICKSCSNEIYISDIYDYNLRKLYAEYRKKNKIIDNYKIQDILIKYSINKETLSLLLGWDIGSISRYLNGDMIEISKSNMLNKIYESTEYYSIILKANRENISLLDYNKSRQAVDIILNKNIKEDKIDAIIKYFLIRGEDFTPFAIQSLLYYTQAFYYIFTDTFLFSEDCEADKDGVIYPYINERYKKYGYNIINKSILKNKNLILNDVERNIAESIIKFYGCYSSKILKNMILNEAPWILTRTEIIRNNKIIVDKKIDKKLIGEYFNGVKEKYNMSNLLDMQKYSVDLFNRISI